MAMSRIVVSFGSSEQWDITGEEGSMREQYDELKALLHLQVDGVHARFFELTGFRNSADRKSEQFIVRVEDIKGVDIQET